MEVDEELDGLFVVFAEALESGLDLPMSRVNRPSQAAPPELFAFSIDSSLVVSAIILALQGSTFDQDLSSIMLLYLVLAAIANSSAVML